MKFTESKTPNLKSIESIIYILIWIAYFSVPFFQNRHLEVVNWEKVTSEWIRTSSFLIIFLFNVYVLIPKLLFNKKYLLFIGFTFLSILIVIGVSISYRFLITSTQPVAMPPMNLGPGMPPMELGSKMPAPMGFIQPTLLVQKSLFMIFLDDFIIAFLVVGVGSTIKLMSQWLNEEGKRKDVEKEQLKTELAFLRQQVNPHFFMNTLNNIHALIDINTEIAKDAIIRLSTLMRYLLYDTANGQTSLKKEIEFIESYFKLMELRFSKKVVISIEVPKNIPDIQIPPMLFISFVENAFKHGVSYKNESFVNFKLDANEKQLNFSIKNSNHSTKKDKEQKYSGIGMVNIKKSLALLFKEDFTLEIRDEEKEFEVQLSIPIYETKVHESKIKRETILQIK